MQYHTVFVTSYEAKCVESGVNMYNYTNLCKSCTCNFGKFFMIQNSQPFHPDLT